MAEPRNIEVEAETLDEAKEQIKAQIPEGLNLLSEQVVSDGKPKSIKAQADTTEMAFAKAQDDIPNNASILERKVLSETKEKVIQYTIEAQDDQSAKTNAEQQMREGGHVATIHSLKLVVAGKKGFLGIGSTRNQYEVEFLEHQPAIVEVTYKTKAKIIAQIGEREAPSVESPTSIQSQNTGENHMSANTLDQIVNHLQFLGYEISQENNITRAKHPKKMSVVIRDYKGGILFASYNVSKDSAKSDKAGFLKFLNLLNANATVARFYADKDFDLCIEAWYPNFYEKENFGVFFEAWGTDSWTLLLANGEEALKYLK